MSDTPSQPTVQEILDFLGNPQTEGALPSPIIEGACSLDHPRAQCITYVTKRRLRTGTPRVVPQCLVLVPHFLPDLSSAQILSSDPRRDFALVVRRFFVAEGDPEIAPSAIIHASARIEPGVSIGHYAVVGENVRIGGGTRLGNGVVLVRNVGIGRKCVIQSHTVIGDEGYGFVRRPDGSRQRMPYLGGVLIGDGVQIGVSTVVFSGTIDPTTIDDHVKIGSLVSVGHNSHIGTDATVLSGALLCGSVTIGRGAWLAPNCSIMNGVTVGDNAVIGLGAVVAKSVAANTTVMGLSARPLKQIQALLRVVGRLLRNPHQLR